MTLWLANKKPIQPELSSLASEEISFDVMEKANSLNPPSSPKKSDTKIRDHKISHIQPKQTTNSSLSTDTSAPAIPIKDLLPNLSTPVDVPQQEQVISKDQSWRTSAIRNDKYGSHGVFGVMQSMGVEEYAPAIPYFAALWKKINEKVDYPKDFKNKRISGIVNIHLELDEKGVFSGDFIEIGGDDNLLKTYVAALLIHNLKDPLPKSFWLKSRKSLTVMLSFRFKTFSDPEKFVRPKGFHLKNILSFHREEFVDNRVNQVVHEAWNHYVPPIVPIPGGFIIDFVRAYQLIANIGEPTESELRDQRLKQLKLELKNAIKNRI